MTSAIEINSEEGRSTRDYWGLAPQSFGKTIVYIALARSVFYDAQSQTTRSFLWLDPNRRSIVKTVKEIAKHGRDLLPRLVICLANDTLVEDMKARLPEAITRQLQLFSGEDRRRGKILNTKGALILTKGAALAPPEHFRE